MDIHQFFITLSCYIFIFLCNDLTAQTVVVYDGPAIVPESEQFSLKCFATHFANFKWRLNESIIYSENSPVYNQTQANNETHQSSTLTVRSALSQHNGNYKCSYESDDYGHNVTVVSGTDIKLKIEYGDEKEHKNEPCPVVKSGAVNTCVLGQVYEKMKMKCRAEPALNSSYTLAWFKKEKEKFVKLTESKRLKISDGDVEFAPLFPDDVGQYQCKATIKGQEDLEVAPLTQILIDVGASPLVVPTFKDLTVVEENTINVTCTVVGKASRISWTFDNQVINSNNNSRVEFKEFNGVPDATLLIKNASTVTDRGHYRCTAETEWGPSKTHGACYVRVKSKYAALGPFLGICAEVIILCTIILIYEKKRDKTELEESDTDQGPETKSSPDHGQDSVRYRK